MKKLLTILFVIISLNAFAQSSIGNLLANSKNKPKGAGYNYYKNGATDIYIHPKYELNSNHNKKMAFIINTDERRFIEFTTERLRKYHYEAYYFYDLTCIDCNDSKSISEVLAKNGIEILVKITVKDGSLYFPTDNEMETDGNNVMVYQTTKGAAGNVKQTLQKVYVEFFDNSFGAETPYIIAKANGKMDEKDGSWKLFKANLARIMLLVNSKEVENR